MSNKAPSSDDVSCNQRLDRLECEMVREDALEMAAFRRLLHGLSTGEVESDPIAKVDTVLKRINHLETVVLELQDGSGTKRIILDDDAIPLLAASCQHMWHQRVMRERYVP